MIFDSPAGLIVILVSVPITVHPRNRMTEWVTYGSVGRAAGDSRSYPEPVAGHSHGTWLRHNPWPNPAQVSAVVRFVRDKVARPPRLFLDVAE